jgi:hypothetical protein
VQHRTFGFEKRSDISFIEQLSAYEEGHCTMELVNLTSYKSIYAYWLARLGVILGKFVLKSIADLCNLTL